MGKRKNPWDDVPIEVIIEYERKKKEREEERRERIHLPVPEYPPTSSSFPRGTDDTKENFTKEHKIVIDFI